MRCIYQTEPNFAATEPSYRLKNVINRIRSLYPFPDESFDRLTALLEKTALRKGHILFQEGKIKQDVYFIEQGIARAYCDKGEQELTFWFGAEGDIIFSYNSYIYNKPGYETVELLEDTVLYKTTTASLLQLYLADNALANWGRKLAEQELVKTEERFISRQFKTAGERYQELLEKTPELLQRVQLGHIAAYLGVTQVTLSRIRAERR